jgi:sulfoxide reductase catalytic subunit YedY
MPSMRKMSLLVALVAILCSTLMNPAAACDFAAAQQRQHRQLQEAAAAGNLTDTDIEIDEVEEEGFANTIAPTVSPNSDCIVDPDSEDLTGLELDLRMRARQARGVIRLKSNCAFDIQQLEVALEDSEYILSLHWYQALSLEVEDVAAMALLAVGGAFAPPDLMGNATAKTLQANQDLATVGAILLVERTAEGESKILAEALLNKLKPGPAADLRLAQPTVFDNCLSLSDTARLRWTVMQETDQIDIGLEYIAAMDNAAGTWAAFGAASPGIEDRLMGGSDVAMGFFRENTDDDAEEDFLAFAEDYYIGGYDVCTPIGDNTYDGVCQDEVWSGSEDTDNVELMYSHVLEGVAFLRMRRSLSAGDPDFDHDITPGTAQHFVWARGPLDESQGIAKVQFHGYQYGQLKDMDLNEPTWTCPPLKGVEVGEQISLEDLDNLEDDNFAQQFEFRTVLQGDMVEVFWTLLPETSQVHMGARAIAGSSTKWMSIAVGESMTDAWAWVATFDGEAQLLAYRMDGLDASTVRLVSEEDEELRMLGEEGTSSVTSDTGRLTFEVTASWPLPGMSAGQTSLPLIWAVGPSWRGPSSSTPRREDEHSVRSKAPTQVDFATGSTSVGDGPNNSMLLAHGAFMFIAWLVMAPFTAVASRYIRDDPAIPGGYKGPNWIQMHKAAATSVLVLSLIGLVLAIVAVNDLSLRHIVSAHAKVGLTVLAMLVVQNLWGMYRPSPENGPVEGPRLFGVVFTHRRIWSYAHRIFAITMLAMAVAAVITGSNSLESYDSQSRYGVTLSVAWIACVVYMLVVYEIRRRGLASTVHQETPLADMNISSEDEDLANAEDPPAADKAKPPPIPKPVSPWTSTWRLVYGFPFAAGVVVLAVLTAVTFSGSPDLESQMMKSSISSDAQSSVATEDAPPTAPVTVGVSEPTSSTTNNGPFSEDCMAFPLAYAGDGWCDDHEPFNTAACGWDGGDCCDINSAIYNCKDPASPNFGASSPKGWAIGTVPRNPRYSVTREESLESFVISYNNYYEFGFTKDVVDEAMSNADFLAPDGWFVDISGLVENPMTVDVTALVEQMQLEERMYRHRCVEAWSITVPWVGFPLSKLLDMVVPKPEAEIVQFQSWKNSAHSKVQASGTGTYPWAYTEALTIDEARNELSIISVGAFGKPLTPQQGAPIRLNVPWKYGFKSIKSIEKITFLADDDANQSRETFWSVVNPREYGFYANINPEVPHRRWSQATERHYVSGFPGTRLPTARMNGYDVNVDYLYEGAIDDTSIYF